MITVTTTGVTIPPISAASVAEDFTSTVSASVTVMVPVSGGVSLSGTRRKISEISVFVIPEIIIISSLAQL